LPAHKLPSAISMAKLRLAASVHAGSGHQVHNGLDLAALAAVAIPHK
jgi:hypothetical protein